MRSVLCPTCGCSLVRLGISREMASHATHADIEHHFCCEGCADIFRSDPDRYPAQIADVVVCPGCLAEKPVPVTVAFEHAGRTINLCGCPHCETALKRDPDGLLARFDNW